MKDIYEYSEAVVRFYDVVNDKILDKSGLNFYLKEIANAGGAVLEVGAGTGRIFVPALQSGADIYGIDQSELMLKKLKEKISKEDSFRVSLQDVRKLSLKKKFKLIVSPFRVFQHLHSIEDQIKALNKIYEHLEEGGKFIFDVFVPNLGNLIKERNDVPEFDGEYEPGRKLQRFATIKHNYIEQILDITFKFIWDENGEQRKDDSKFSLRYFFRYELENLIGRTKFKLDKMYGDFNRGELNNDSKDFVIVCLKL
ncbi:MAG: class I SAM-dependent methyltransferase [Bacteroidota bacterium]|nr:class I SAM-dependent methyltransferase [Bacteroidota bacterium]